MATFDYHHSGPARIVVLSGGDSAEREVSRESGAAVRQALVERGHQVMHIDPADANLSTFGWGDYDVAFLALHGTFGEDGAVQSLLEEVGIAYTGSNAATSRLAFSKSASKERFAQFSVPTPPYALVHESDDAARILNLAENLGYPLVVKPDAQGSSLGVSIVASPDDLPEALTRCFDYGAFGILETAIVGSEWTLGLLDEMPLPLLEIETDREFFDYRAKYHDNRTRYRFELDLPMNVIRQIETAGRRACESLNTSGLARVDIRLDRAHRPWVLEVNTIPGLTAHSLIPKAAARLGISFGELCERAVQSALQKVAA